LGDLRPWRVSLFFWLLSFSLEIHPLGGVNPPEVSLTKMKGQFIPL